MEEDRPTFDTLEAAFIEGRLSRRDFLRRSARIGATAAAMSLLGSLGLTTKARAQGPKKGGTLVIAKESELDILDPHSAGGWVTWRVTSRCTRASSTKTSPRPTCPIPTHPQARDLLGHLQGLADLHLQAPQGRQIPRRHALRCRRGEVQHRPLRGQGRAAVLPARQRLHDVDLAVPQGREDARRGHRADRAARAVRRFPPPAGPGGRRRRGLHQPHRAQEVRQQGHRRAPTGTGPFRFVERVRGEKVVTERNPNYWGTQPYLDRIIDRPMPEPAARMTALQAGEVDMVYVPHPDGIADLRTKGFKLEQGRRRTSGTSRSTSATRPIRTFVCGGRSTWPSTRKAWPSSC